MKIVKPFLQLIKEIPSLLKVFKNGNRFLVVEILNHQNKVTLVKADFDKKTFHFIRALSGKSLEKLLAKFGKLTNYQIVACLDPKFATTIHSAVSIIRENSREPIDEGDLDNLISRAIWSFFDRQRSKVAAKMEISDLDVVLSDARIQGIKLDGHKVVNPLGFLAKTAEIQLSLTFTPREFINNLKNLLPKDVIVFIGEDGAAFCHLLSQGGELDSFALANLFPGQTVLFTSDGNSIAYLDKFDWGEVNLVKALIERLGVNAETAAKVLNRYVQCDTSPFFVKRMENLLMPELCLLVGGLERALKETNSRNLYLHSFFPLPPAVLSGAFKNKFNLPVRLLTVNNNIVSEKFNHELKLRSGVETGNALATLSGILLSALPAQSERANRIAKRRIRWLI